MTSWSRLRRSSGLLLALCCFVLTSSLGAGRAYGQISSSSGPPAAPQTLEVIEDLSESLANDMLDFSVAARDRDAVSLAPFFAAQVAGPALPTVAGPDRPEHRWFVRHSWSEPASMVAGARAGAVERDDLLDWLRHFDAIEDVRFKVRQATFDDGSDVVVGAKTPTARPGARGRGTIGFFVVGRDAKGRREWARGSWDVVVVRGEARWLFEVVTPKALESMVATTEMFSEVALPAGVEARLPAFGDGGNESFAWHGAAAADFDGDGWIDIFATGPLDSTLYRNDGAGHFTDVSAAVGLQGVDSGVAVLALDYDNDGDTDVFITAVGKQTLLENRLTPDGVLRFRDVSVQAGVAVSAVGFSASAADVNGDGLLDVYVACYNHYGRVTPDSWHHATNGTPNLLFINQGGGRFRESAHAWGVDDRRWSYAASFADVNADGRPDLYVANDFGENALFINHGDHFEDEAVARGVVDPGNGMGADFGDFDNDGLVDLVVTNMSSTAGNRILGRLFPSASPQQNVLKKLASGNSLFRNTGNGTFREVTAAAGGIAAGWAWGGGFIDLDNDGWQDLYFPNGFISGKSMKDT